MLVAVSQRNDKNKYGVKFDSLENDYVKYLESFGLSILQIPNSSKNIDFYFSNFPIEGVILTGGNDINPKCYGGEFKGHLSISDERDKTEKSLLEISLKRDLPVLGICRGMQFINIFFGGKLVNIENKNHVNKNHAVKIINSRNKVSSKIMVNSFHNQGLTKDELSGELKIFALSGDDFIEGIYHPNKPIVGIQWHLERDNKDKEFNTMLMNRFVNKKFIWRDER